jgi:O-antigen biosynthesis protein
VLVCLPFLTIGGVEKILSQICRGLKPEGFHFTVISTVGTLLSQGNSAEWFEPATSDIFCLPECLPQESWKGFVSYLISSRKVDILWQAGSTFIYELLPELRTRFPELKVVDNLFNDVGHTANNRKYDCLIDLHVVESNSIRQWLTGHGESEDRIRVIPNGVELSSFETNKRPPAPFDTGGRGFVVGFFGRLSEEKGPDLFVEIAARLKHEKNILFVIGGHGLMENAVRAQIARRGLQDSVKMLGFCAVETHLSSCDLLALPSRQDGRPNVVMEAMAMGVPVIASRVGGLAELVLEGDSGYLCDPVDTRQFAERIAMLAHNPELCEKLRAGAQKHARASFDIRQTVSAFNGAFRELLRQPAPAQLMEVAAQ